MKFKALLMLAPLALLSACERPADTGKDGYQFQSAEYVRHNHDLEVVIYDNRMDLELAYRKMTNATIGRDTELMAFAELSTGKCRIHMLDAQVRYEPEFLGHELAHCIYGQFHSD